jgi:alpha-1,6-mannosyltransferase
MEATQKAAGETPQRPWWIAAVAFAFCCFVFAAAWPERGARGLRRGLGMAFPLALLGIQYACWRLLRSGQLPSRRTLWMCVLLMASAALVIPAFHSSDLYAYAQAGRIQTTYEANPYVRLPSDLPGFDRDPYFTTTWRDTPCVYGPVFALVARGTVALAGDDAAAARWLFRLWNVVLLALLVGWLLRWHTQGREAQVAAWLLASSPLLLLHFVGNGHNDLWMTVPLVGAFLALRAERPLLVLPLLALATAVKFVALLTLPFFLLGLIRRHGLARTGTSFVLALATGLLLSAPFLSDLGAFRFEEIRRALGRPASSIVANVMLLTDEPGAPWPTVGSVQRILHLLVVAGLLVWQLRAQQGQLRRAPERRAESTLAAATNALLLVLAVASPTWAPWYLGLLLPLGLALPPDSLTRHLTWGLSLSWTLAFTPLGRIRDFDALLLTLPVCVWALCAHLSRGRERTPGGPART